MNQHGWDDEDFLSLIPPEYDVLPLEANDASFLDLDLLLQQIGGNSCVVPASADSQGRGTNQEEDALFEDEESRIASPCAKATRTTARASTYDVINSKKVLSSCPSAPVASCQAVALTYPSDLDFTTMTHPRFDSFNNHEASAAEPVAIKAKYTKSDIVAPEQQKRNHNQSRKRQQEERHYLRDKVKKQTDLLNKLLLESVCPTENNEDWRPTSSIDSTATELRLAQRKSALQRILSLKRVAVNEQENSELALMESMRLRIKINECYQIISEMESEIHKHWSAWPRDPYTNFLHPTNRAIGGSNFDRLGRDLDTQYHSLGSVWEACGLAGIYHEKETQYSQLKCGTNGPYFEFVHSFILPFAPAAVARVGWQCVQRGIVTQTNGELKVQKSLGNTLYASMVDYVQLQQQQCDFRMEMVLKRFFESDRVVIVWESLFHFPTSPNETTQLIENGWILAQAISGASKRIPDTVTGAPCVIQMCAHARGVNEELADGTFVIEAIKLHRRQMLAMDQITENILMDEMLGIASSTHGSHTTSKILLSPRVDVF